MKTRKNILVAFLSVCMIATCLPMTAFAGDTVCRIGSQEYASISEAVEAAQNGTETTITIIADVTLDSTVVIPEGKRIVLTDDGTKRSLAAGSNTIFNVEGELTLKGTSNDNLVLNGGECHKSSIADVSGTMTLQSGTINGGTIKDPENNISGAITVVNGTFNMSGGYIQNTVVDDSRINAPVRIYNGGKMNMSGGEIRNNEGVGGGIVALTNTVSSGTTLPTADAPVVNISGGKICNNKGLFGSAVYAPYNAIVNISGGEISGNSDITDGRGQGTLYFSRSFLNMTGGVIKDNQMNQGGAIYAIRESKIHITGGSIINNTAGNWGGAIFLIDDKPEVYLENALITDNEASRSGGGLWCCPTGTSKVLANEGVAIFDNKAQGAGDDITNLYTDKQEFNIELSDRMLGAGAVDYYKDGEVYMLPRDDSEYWHGGINEDAPRYGEIYEKVNPDDMAEKCLALKTVATDEAKDSAKVQSKVIIQGNKACYGGAIACNGAVFGGTGDTDKWSLKVKKSWDNVPEDRRVEVTVALVVNGDEVDTVDLNAENGWENTFRNLPDPATVEGGYTVVEKTKGFKATYSEVVTDPDDPTVMEVNVTNSLEEEKEKPKEEEKTPKKEKDKPEKEKKGGPSTGDESNAGIYLVLMLASGAALVINRRKLFNK